MVSGGFILNFKSLKLANEIVEHILSQEQRNYYRVINFFKSLKILLKLVKAGVLIFLTKTAVVVYLEVGDMVSLVRAIIIVVTKTIF